MTIHVVVPAYNSMPWLPTCLGSLASQTYPDFDVTVIDPVAIYADVMAGKMDSMMAA